MRTVVLLLVVVLGVAQFIQPARNEGPATPGPNDVFVRHPAPVEVRQAVEAACYDCHSNRTRYPWYAKVQPVAWWVAHHVDEGKDELNFSEFGAYPAKRAAHKLDESIEMVQGGEMPLSSYRWMHAEAEWTPAQKAAFVEWAGTLAKTLAPASSSR